MAKSPPKPLGLDGSLEHLDKRIMTTSPPRISAARRNAEALLGRATKKEEGFKLELRREQEEMASKTARLRALRLAKEEADHKVAAMQPDRPTKTRRSKQK
jgi:hypothetical protein